MPASNGPRPRAPLARIADLVLYRFLTGFMAVLRALPARWVLRLGDAVGETIALVNVRSRRVGRQNLAAAFGSALPPRVRHAIVRASLRSAARAVLLTAHMSPLTPKRMRRWVDVPEGLHASFLEGTAGGRRGGVLVSAHFGNWEALLGLTSLFPDLPPVRYLAEAIASPVVDRVLARMRGSGGSEAVLRKGGGARALDAHVREGGVAAVLADRNVSRAHGGIWVPFLGLPARTTPLPAWLAVRNRVELRAIFALPRSDGGCRIACSEDLAAGVDPGDEDAAIRIISGRINRELETRIRACPEAWNWSQKRFKSRPLCERGPYPAYSIWDPDAAPRD